VIYKTRRLPTDTKPIFKVFPFLLWHLESRVLTMHLYNIAAEPPSAAVSAAKDRFPVFIHKPIEALDLTDIDDTA
jgi:hypothetical protein